ncbi:GEVED domain-containing protein [Bizionia hallyeonensis]|uniref:GEVED domain-containing protein n=1 Tax=Bizionia hallyeonensis TaxID=1123757 RepID=A0ABW0C1G9_9FLAO
MKHKYALIFITFLCAVLSGFGQVTLHSETFEGLINVGYSSTGVFSDGSKDYFTLIDNGSDPSGLPSYTNFGGVKFWAGEDTQDAGNPNTSGISNVSISSINISGYSSINILGLFGAGSSSAFDNEDYIRIYAQVDGSGYTLIGAFEGTGGFNTSLNQDTNLDGTGNGTALTTAFQQFLFPIGSTGSNLDLRIDIFMTSGDEAVAFDNIEVEGILSCTPPVDPNGTITGTTPACTNTILTYSGTTILGTIDYWQTTATGTSTANNATGTFNATATGTYYVRRFLTATSCWSAGTASYAVVINSAPSISTQPANATRVIPNNATFSVAATGTPAPTYQWQVSTNGGTTWTNVTGGSGATTNTYTTGATSAPMNGNQYRCVVTNSCGAVTSAARTLTLSNNSPTNAQNLTGCFEDTSATLTWNNPSTPPTGGYIIFALEGTVQPSAPSNNANTYTANPNYNAAPFETPPSLGKVIYKGNGTTAALTGLTEGTTYSFRIFAYNGETLTGWSNGASGGSNLEDIAQGDVRNLVATPLTNQVNLSWNNPLPTSCFDQLIIVANAGAVTFTPTGTYPNIDVNYTTPSTILYSTTAPVSSKAMNGLTNGTNYCFKIFIRRGATWSEGVEVCAVPSLTYCSASGNTSYDTGITGVTFNTINNIGTSANNAYTNYTMQSTIVTLGNNYNLGVVINIDGAVDVYTRAWIDWNQNGSFNDSGEQYELGMDTNTSSSIDLNTATANSPINIEVPTDAVLGATRMRVFTQYNNLPTSCATGNSGEVEDYTINVVQPVNAEINIKGNNISIANGFNAPYGLNNTLFASTPLNTDSVEKEFTIENIGLANLLLTGSPIIQLEGTNPTDFIVTQHATSPVVNGTNTTFRIKFHPTVAGTRTAKVRIENNDSDENPYLFTIEGEGNCTTAPTVATFPTSGPANTLVTFTSATSNLIGATITYNNIAVPTVSNTSDTIEVLIPSDANDGNFVIQLATGCSATQFFDVIDTDLTACDTAVGGGDATDLIIYEAYDENGGSGGVITIYNNTGASVNLSGYSIQRAGDYGGTYSTYANLSGTLAANAVAIISVSSSSCGYTPTGNGSLGSAGFNANDGLRLMNGTTVIDDVHAPNYVGYYLKRKNTNFYPNTTYTATEWTAQSLSDDECLAGVGTVPLVKVPPVVITHPQYVADCSITGTSLTVAGSEGVSGGLGLAYQWYVLGTSGNWTAVSNGGIYSGSTTSTLDISDLAGLDDYQYYCQIRENTATCYAASNAVKIEYIAAVWDGTAWSSTPTSSKIAIINGDYDTSTNVNGETSFEACQLFVAAGSLLTVSEGDYVEVINSAVVNGDGTNLDGILVEDKGSFVQRGEGVNAGTYTLNTNARTQVNKKTAPLNNYYEYTYWSSPVANETIENGLNDAHPTRRYWYNGKNYLDAMAETNNNNGTVAGQDDVDDNGDDWQPTSNTDIMIPGKGYAAMHSPSGIIGIGINYEYTFNGALNTGDFTVPIYRNDSEMADNNWNFIGNPYPSAIDADLFLSANALIDQNVTEYPQPTGVTNGAIFLWSQNSAPSNTNNGNEALNFAQSDYAVINGTGQTAGGDGVMPSRFIPSGQGFFITLSNAATVSTVSGDIKTADVIFQNSMRVTGNNNQFFRNTNENQNEKLWLNFTSDMGVFNQILIGYVEGATNGNDDMYFDAPKNLSSDSYVYFYSLIEEELEADKVAIQGKAPESLNMDEIIPLGFSTTVNQATIYTISIAQFEGDFLSINTIYLKDQLLNVIHNLSNTNYNFTSTVGEFNDRFEIVFRDSTLSVDDYVISNINLSIIELMDNNVKFSIGSNHATIKSVEIIDMLGRTLYKFKGSTNTETYNLSNLSSATYIAKVTLSNNQVLVKKAVKK